MGESPHIGNLWWFTVCISRGRYSYSSLFSSSSMSCSKRSVCFHLGLPSLLVWLPTCYPQVFLAVDVYPYIVILVRGVSILTDTLCPCFPLVLWCYSPMLLPIIQALFLGWTTLVGRWINAPWHFVAVYGVSFMRSMFFFFVCYSSSSMSCSMQSICFYRGLTSLHRCEFILVIPQNYSRLMFIYM